MQKFSKSIRLVALIAAVGCAQTQGRDHPRAHLSDRFFEAEGVARFEITVPEAGMKSLKGLARAYTPCVIRIGSRTYADVGIHLKGGAGSFQRIDQKPSFTLNFDKYVGGQKFHGLDKIHLNNSLQDPTYLKEWICSRLFFRAGVPAPRASHAQVSLNGRDLGLYVLKEGYEKTFLKRHFPDASGNLYDGGLMMDVDQPLEKDSGKNANDRSDLARLVLACQQEGSERRLALLQSVLDWDQFMSFLAMEIITWHWDGYGMKANNYRLYHDPSTDRFVFMPHGMDQMFWESQGPLIPAMRGLVARAAMSTDQGRRDCMDRIETFAREVLDVDQLTCDVRRQGQRLGDVLRETDSQSADLYTGHVRNLIELVAKRGQFLLDQFEEGSVPQNTTTRASPTPKRAVERIETGRITNPAGIAPIKPTTHP